MDKIKLEMPVTVYGNIEKYNEVISKARCRIFYKYANRNGTYITDEFANELLASVPYAPVKGIYDNFEQDYTDHGTKRSLGRIYGVVPENPNIGWEKHLDEDGIEREYACVDVLIFTGLYEEAEQIVGKSQSMEIYDKSIDGEWQFIDGKKYYVFKKGCFLGLQVLGDEVEPCFEGASFFSMINPIKELIQQYENFQKQGGHKMPILNFKLSDGQKYEALWTLLNSNYTEESNWSIDYTICDVYDDYAVARNFADNSFERIYYTKDDSNDSIVINAKKKCYIIDVSEEELGALKMLHELNGSTYEKIDEVFNATKTENEELKLGATEFEQKIEELNESVSTLTTERDEFVAKLEGAATRIEEMQTEYAALKEDCDNLASFKATVEKNEKESIIASYSDKLSAQVIENYTAKIDEFNAESLKKELAYEFVNSNPTVFSNVTPTYVPKDEPKSGIEQILSKYKK